VLLVRGFGAECRPEERRSQQELESLPHAYRATTRRTKISRSLRGTFYVPAAFPCVKMHPILRFFWVR
jgi:hypothetical protein